MNGYYPIVALRCCDILSLKRYALSCKVKTSEIFKIAIF